MTDQYDSGLRVLQEQEPVLQTQHNIITNQQEMLQHSAPVYANASVEEHISLPAPLPHLVSY